MHAQGCFLRKKRDRGEKSGRIKERMAKFVIAGKVDCAAYARAELLADQLASSLPDFHVHKVPVPSAEWVQWVSRECRERGWAEHRGEVLVWRELVKRGGRGLYIGEMKELQDYASHYHNISPLTDTSIEQSIAEESRQTLEADRLEAESRTKPRPLRVAVTSASSSLAYHLIQRLASGDMFGEHLVSLRLLDTPTHSDEVSGVAMEITDMASPCVESIHCTSSVLEAFQSASLVFILEDQWGEQEEGVGEESPGCESREQTEEGEGEEGGVKESEKVKMVAETEEREREATEEGRKGTELDSALVKAVTLYHKYGRTLDFCAQKSVRVIVSGRFSNLGAALIAHSATSIPRTNIIAAPCLAEQRAKSIIARRLSLNTADIEQVCVWGRCGGGEGVLLDARHTRVSHYQGAIVGPDPFSLPLDHCLHNPAWLTSDLLEDVRERERRDERGGGLSEAVAIAEMVHHWSDTNNTDSNSRAWCSVGVVSDGENCYGFPVGVVCSVPVRREGGEWKVVHGLELAPTVQEKLVQQRDSLAQELQLALNLIESSSDDGTRATE